MEQIVKIFIALMRSEICGVPVEPQVLQQINPILLEQLYVVSRNHDLTHVLAVALKKHGLLGEDLTSKKFIKSMYGALVRHEAMEHEKNKIFQLFEKEKIVFVPLKGSVIRRYYTQEWMRTSCDIDILVREEDLKRARKALVSSLGYEVHSHKYHDISLYSPTGILLELHFKIEENIKSIDKYLERVWEYVRMREPGSYQYEMTSEYLMFHAFSHMLYHFLNGGCGVKFVTDIWLLEQHLKLDDKIFRKFCRECKIETFVRSVRKLAAVWYSDEKHDSTTLRLERYIMTGGVFGNVETKITARKTKTPGQLKYMFQRIFIPYEEFCTSFPKLKKYPFLYPYYTVKRWCKVFDKTLAKNAWYELKVALHILPEEVDELKQLFKDLKV